MAERLAAKLTIKSPGKMTKAELADVIKWLEKQAKDLRRQPNAYTDGPYTARLWWLD